MKNLLQKAAFASAAGLLAMGAIVTKVGAEESSSVVSSSSVGGGSSMITLTNVTPQNVSVATEASSLIKTIITLVIIVAALLTLFYLIMGAIAWITSGGDKGKVEEARNKITAAVIGLLILAAVWAIFQLVLTIGFGGTGLTIQKFV